MNNITQRHCINCNTTETIWWKIVDGGYQCNKCYKHEWYKINRGSLKRVVMTHEELVLARKRNARKYRENHRKERKEYNDNRKDIKSRYDKTYREVNKEILEKKSLIHRENTKNKKREYDREYRKNNAQRIKLLHRNKLRLFIRNRIRQNLKQRQLHIIRTQQTNKQGKFVELAGIGVDGLMSYLESKFKKGMSWDNYGTKGWHIDHIKPLCLFDLTQLGQQKIAFHYANLQPLWWFENMKKGKKYE